MGGIDDTHTDGERIFTPSTGDYLLVNRDVLYILDCFGIFRAGKASSVLCVYSIVSGYLGGESVECVYVLDFFGNFLGGESVGCVVCLLDRFGVFE